ncbi:SpaH/EbpB family LPXTG-anchored major pilin [Demequina pelophila]|uniref:SpaH/EbpB family LPXTG-anchored major pilin n=1 Tax=Demequina pelophila TaxID=1638984 RepID=UPI0007813194|nr:SpaH/EbpB family LPXTG-anchored major pilin [Demequina pelophila]
MISTTRPAVRFAGLAATAALSCGLILGGAAGAMAADATLIDDQHDGSITIHGGAENAEFSVTRVTAYVGQDLDLTTDAGWQAAQDLSTDVKAAGGWDAFLAGKNGGDVDLATPTTITADASGDASAAALDLGIYAVTETVVPAGHVAATSFVTPVPMTDPAGLNQWVYDIEADVKDDQVTATKTVVDAPAADSDQDTVWTIDVDVPKDINTLTDFAFRDELDPRLNVADASAVTLTWVDGTGADQGDASAAFDLVVSQGTAPAGDIVVATAKKDATAIQAIEDAAAATHKLRVVITTDVTSMDASNPIIPNQANVYTNATDVNVLRTPAGAKTPGVPAGTPGGPTGTPGELTPTTQPDGTTKEVRTPSFTPPTFTSQQPPLNTDVPVVKWGSLEIKKTDLASGDALAGAEFQIFASEQDALDGTNPLHALDGTTATFVTDANGIASVDGLRFSEWANNAAATGDDIKSYWVVETKAPADHELSVNSPQEVTVSDIDADAEVTFADAIQRAGFDLPMTGGTGTMLISLAGVGVLGAAGALMLADRKRKADAQA